MKNIPITLNHLFLLFLLLSSCQKLKDISGLNPSNSDLFAEQYNPGCSTKPEYVENSLVGTYRSQPICLYDYVDGVTFKYGTYVSGTSKPGQVIDFNDTSKLNGWGLEIGIIQRFADTTVEFTFRSKRYELDTPVQRMIDDLGENYKNNENLPIASTDYLEELDTLNHSRYRLFLLGDIDPKNNSSFRTGVKWIVYSNFAPAINAKGSDQYQRWIKVTHFEKNDFGAQYEYRITLDININLYRKNKHFGRLKAKWNAHFYVDK